MSEPVEIELLEQTIPATIPSTTQISLELFEVLGGGTGGGGSGSDVLEIVVAQDTPAYSLVTADGLIGNSNTLAHWGKIVGMTPDAVLSGTVASLVVDDEVTNVLWAWSPGTKLFLNGTTISATSPSSGFSQLVAVARNANVIIVRLEPPILL